MFEAKLVQASMLRKVLDAIRELVSEGNFDCSGAGVTLQAMDSAHVSLIALQLRPNGFDPFRCDRSLNLGMNLASMSRILKCAGNEDSVTINAEDNADVVEFRFESATQDKISKFQLKLMNIDSEFMSIPETEYACVVKMASNEFQKICRDLMSMGESVTISCTKEGIHFITEGDLGRSNIFIPKTSAIDAETTTVIDIIEPVELTFALRYLTNFTKATPLSTSVTLSISDSSPLLVEYKIDEIGYIRYYLAPKIDETED